MKVIILTHPQVITKWVNRKQEGDSVIIQAVGLHKKEAKTLKQRMFLTQAEMENLLTKGVRRRARMCPLWLTSPKVRQRWMSNQMLLIVPSILDQTSKVKL